MPLRVTTTFSGVTGAPYYSIMHLAGETSGDAVAATAAVRAFWQALVASMAAPTHIQVNPEVEFFGASTGVLVQLFNAPVASSTAGGGGEPLPWGTQALVRWRTGVFGDGREIRGRTFIPSLTEGHNTGGAIASTLVTILQDAADDLLPLMGVWRRPRVYNPPSQPLEDRDGEWHPAATASVPTTWTTLRTRRT